MGDVEKKRAREEDVKNQLYFIALMFDDDLDGYSGLWPPRIQTHTEQEGQKAQWTFDNEGNLKRCDDEVSIGRIPGIDRSTYMTPMAYNSSAEFINKLKSMKDVLKLGEVENAFSEGAASSSFNEALEQMYNIRKGRSFLDPIEVVKNLFSATLPEGDNTVFEGGRRRRRRRKSKRKTKRKSKKRKSKRKTKRKTKKRRRRKSRR